jgi:hypothetical protein
MVPIPGGTARVRGEACGKRHRFSAPASVGLEKAGTTIHLGSPDHKGRLNRDRGPVPGWRGFRSLRRRGEDTAPYRGGS